MLKDYLFKNGFKNTFKKLANQNKNKPKGNIRKFKGLVDFNSQTEIGLTIEDIITIRNKVVNENDWLFILNLDDEKQFLSSQLRGNIILIDFLQKFAKKNIQESEKLILFQNYENRFKDYKNEIIFKIDQTL